MSCLAAAACADTPPDLAGAEPLACGDALETRAMRIDRVEIPVDQDAAASAAIDVDADGDLDNQLGSAFAAFLDLYPDLGPALPARIERRLGSDSIWVIEVEQCHGDARVTLGRGELDGERVRVLERGSLPAGGWSRDGEIRVRDGVGLAPLAALTDVGDAGADAWNATFPTEIGLVLEDGEANGVIDGALSPGYYELIAATVLPFLESRVGDGTTAEIFDDNDDGAVTLDELEASGLFHTVLEPDLDVGVDALDPPDHPPLDGVAESLSFGLRFHAVDVEVE
jgi:hypothetical protein